MIPEWTKAASACCSLPPRSWPRGNLRRYRPSRAHRLIKQRFTTQLSQQSVSSRALTNDGRKGEALLNDLLDAPPRLALDARFKYGRLRDASRDRKPRALLGVSQPGLGSLGFCCAEFLPSQTLCGCYTSARCSRHSTTLRCAVERTECSQSLINGFEPSLKDSVFGGKCLDNRL